MRDKTRITLLCIALSCLTLAGRSTASADDLEKLQGEWILERQLINRIRIEHDEDIVMTIADNKMSGVATDEWEAQVTFSIDESTNPKQLTQLVKIKTDTWVGPGIYKLDGDRLIICCRRGTTPDIPMRPTEFKSDKDTYLVIWRRRVQDSS